MSRLVDKISPSRQEKLVEGHKYVWGVTILGATTCLFVAPPVAAAFLIPGFSYGYVTSFCREKIKARTSTTEKQSILPASASDNGASPMNSIQPPASDFKNAVENKGADGSLKEKDSAQKNVNKPKF